MMTHAAHAQAPNGSNVLDVTQVEGHLQAKPGHLQEDLPPLQLLPHSLQQLLQQLLSSPSCTPLPSIMRASSLSMMVSLLAGDL
jgi:hypothetical protein